MTRIAQIRFAGIDMVLDPSGALFCVAENVLVVADLHFEKGRSIGLRTRRPLPPHDTDATLLKLAGAVQRHDPATIVCLGDSFHDTRSAHRFLEIGDGHIRQMAAGRRWIWICGNHDPLLPAELTGESLQEFRLGSLVLRHDDADGGQHDDADGGQHDDADGGHSEASGMVIGHYHPAALALLGGRMLRRPCFAMSTRLLVMPAFGAYTGGLNVLHPDLARLLGPDFRVWILGGGGVFPVSRSRLLANAPAPFGRA